MGYIKIFSEKDNTIVERYPDYNFGRDAELWLGSTFKFNEATGVYDSTKAKSRALIQFDLDSISATLSSITGSFTANLVMFDNTNIYEHRNSEPFLVNAYAMSLSWDQGIGREIYISDRLDDSVLQRNADTYSNWNYRDRYGNTWSGSAVAGSTTSLSGGAWYPSVSASLLQYGHEHSIFDITHFVQQWINGDIENNGIILKLDDEYESKESTYSISAVDYWKSYFSRHTHSIWYPYIEILYDTQVKDDRGDFYRGVPQRFYLYNFLYGKMHDIDSTNPFAGTVSLRESSSTAYIATGLSANRFSEGIYYVDYTYTGGATSLIDEWTVTSSASSIFNSMTGSIIINTDNYAHTSLYNDTQKTWIINFDNIEDTYRHGAIFDLRVSFYKPWQGRRTLLSFYDSQVSNRMVMKEAYISFLDTDTGYVALPPTLLNYDNKGNWIEVNTENFPANKRYVPVLWYYDQGKLNRKLYNKYSFFVR